MIRLAQLAIKLGEGAAHKDEPWSSAHNTALQQRGDIISVSEGDLWALVAEARTVALAASFRPPGTGFRVHCEMQGQRVTYDIYDRALADFKDGFWTNPLNQYTNGSDCHWWIPPSRIVYVEKIRL